MAALEIYSPLELICIDFLALESDDCDTRNLCVVTHYITGKGQACPIKDQTAKTLVTTAWEIFLCHYGFPKRRHRDQGENSESELIAELRTLVWVK